MAAAIGEPSTDPHGAPIPTREGTIAEERLASLATVPVGKRVRIQRVGDRDAEQLRYLAEIGITPGRQVEVIARAPFDGPIDLRIGRVVRSIGPALARQIAVAS
jgi:DtxR family Mn-dependent transcriptional regulator